jgi:hypothetical protein
MLKTELATYRTNSDRKRQCCPILFGCAVNSAPVVNNTSIQFEYFSAVTRSALNKVSLQLRLMHSFIFTKYVILALQFQRFAPFHLQNILDLRQTWNLYVHSHSQRECLMFSTNHFTDLAGTISLLITTYKYLQHTGSSENVKVWKKNAP